MQRGLLRFIDKFLLFDDLHWLFRSMIGEPTNFQHTAHIGSRDVEMPDDQLTALQMQMKSKGGYETTYKVSLKNELVYFEFWIIF